MLIIIRKILKTGRYDYLMKLKMESEKDVPLFESTLLNAGTQPKKELQQ